MLMETMQKNGINEENCSRKIDFKTPPAKVSVCRGRKTLGSSPNPDALVTYGCGDNYSET